MEGCEFPGLKGPPIARHHETKQTYAKVHHCEISEHWGKRRDLTSSQTENNNSQQRIRNWITLSFSKAILARTDKTMEQCLHYSEVKLFPTQNSIPRLLSIIVNM